MLSDQLAEYIAKIRCDCQITLFVQLLRFQTRPAAIYFAAADRAAKDHHDVPVTVIRATVSIFPRSPAKLGHRYQNNVGHAIAHIPVECCGGVAERLQQLVQLRHLFGVMIQSANFAKGGFPSCTRFDNSGNLLQVGADLAAYCTPFTGVFGVRLRDWIIFTASNAFFPAAIRFASDDVAYIVSRAPAASRSRT